jgi:cbb3-type cytochrome oxidase maturation protein
MGLYILIPLSVVVVFLIGLVFYRSLKGGQFDDLEGPGFRILVEDPDPEREKEELAARARREAAAREREDDGA